MTEGEEILNGNQDGTNKPVNSEFEIINQPGTEAMEIHHHAHPVAPGEKKKFKEYFLEFLMIFLAVTLGFFAETIRENISEHHRAEIFAAEMLNDLKTDTAELIRYRNYMAYAAGNVDTLLQLLAAAEPKDIPSGKLYWYGLYGGAYSIFISNDATFQQMKSSGSLRFFAAKLAQQVAQYDRLCRAILLHQESDRDIYLEVRKARAQLFQFKYNMEANDISQINKTSFSQQRIIDFILSNPPLLSSDKTIFNQYIEMVRSRFHRNYVKEADTLLSHADKLIIGLKKEYHLDDE